MYLWLIIGQMVRPGFYLLGEAGGEASPPPPNGLPVIVLIT